MQIQQLTYGAATDIGMVRRRNEDAWYADADLGLFIVCDGMGGRRAGDVAGRLAVEVMVRCLAQAPDRLIPPAVGAAQAPSMISPATRQLVDAVRAANHRLYGDAAANPEHHGMGTTVVAARIAEQRLSVVHVGDSRLYLLRAGELRALTTDHSVAQARRSSGRPETDEPRDRAAKHLLTRAVGVQAVVDVDHAEYPLRPGDRLLLCSDGLTGALSDRAILEALTREADPQAAADRLIACSNAAAGTDNTTVIIVHVAGESTTLDPPRRTNLCASPSPH